MNRLVLIAAIIFSFSFFIPKASYSQVKEITIDQASVVEERAIYLNGGLRSMTEGASRIIIPVHLPENTVSWYYSFTTYKGESGIKNLNLAVQLAAMAYDPTGISSAVTSNLKVPQGTSVIDVYLLPSNNTQAFLEKWDNNGGSFNYFTEGTAQNTKQAVVAINELRSGRYYLGLKNPSTLDGVNVKIEVVALVEKEEIIDEWNSENRIAIFEYCNQSILVQSLEKKNICDCIVDQITTEHLPSLWFSYSGEKQDLIYQSSRKECFNITGNSNLLEVEDNISKKLDRIDMLLKEANAASEFEDYETAYKNYSSVIAIVESDSHFEMESYNGFKASLYGSAAWISILAKELADTKSLLIKAYALDSSSMLTTGNMANYHMIQDNYSKAIELFKTYKRKDKLPDGRKWIDVIEEDILILERLGYQTSAMRRIKDELRIK